MDDAELTARARTLASVIEPSAGQVYFSPECHSRYAALGFSPSPAELRGVAMPDGPAYFCSRGSVMGQVPGEVVAATFAVFNPAVVVPAVGHGWTLTDATAICRARTEGAVAQLARVLGENPAGVERVAELLRSAGAGLRVEGRPLFAGLASQPVPDGHLGAAWRYADRLREYRGDSHIAAWTSAGFDAVEIGLLTELYWGLPAKTYIRTRGWTDADLDAGLARLEHAGLVAGGSLTGPGRQRREAVEVATDRACRPVIEAVGDGFDELVDLLRPMGESLRQAGAYPSAGPHDLASSAAGDGA